MKRRNQERMVVAMVENDRANEWTNAKEFSNKHLVYVEVWDCGINPQRKRRDMFLSQNGSDGFSLFGASSPRCKNG